MYRRIFLSLALLLSILSVSSASAQQSHAVNRFDSRTIDSSVKCELSAIARSLAQSHVDSARMKAHLTITGDETMNLSGGFTIGLPLPWLPSAGGTTSNQHEIIRGIEGDRNISVDNKINCKKSFVVDVGVISCFRDEGSFFLNGDTITCSSKTTATGTVNASGKIQLWLVNVGPSGSLSKTRVFTVALVIPPQKK